MGFRASAVSRFARLCSTPISTTRASRTPTMLCSMCSAGGQRVRGIETAMNGHITNRWDAQVSYAYLDSAVVSSNAYPAGDRRAARQRSAAYVHLLADLQAALPDHLRRGRKFRRHSHRQFHRAARSHHRAGQASTRLLGVQRDGGASAYGTHHAACQHLQSGGPLLLRSAPSRPHRSWGRAARLLSVSDSGSRQDIAVIPCFFPSPTY